MSAPARALQLVRPGVGPAEFTETLSNLPSGLSVVTTMNGDGCPHGTTVSAFCSLSLDPPLVLVALNHSSELLRHLRANGRFGVNVLSADQKDVGVACGCKAPDKMAAIHWRTSDGLPRIEGAAAWVACDVHDILPGGDHEIVTGRVTGCASTEADALVFHRRGFHRLER
jgi:flavin reductase (DIM6/NTAB) family NADH-FMN oxidoreductase RutF